MIRFAAPLPARPVYAAADALLAERGHSFHWARRLLGARHAERATRLYGFCRRVDDLADEAVDRVTARAELAVIRRALQSGESGDGGIADMLQLIRDCAIDPTVVLELLRGIEGDLDVVRVADMDELLRYCHRVAGTVGLMMASALDVTAAEASPHASDLGIAMQLTNICRDVREDALLGRRYLPATLVGSLEPASLVDPTASVKATVARALGALLDLADERYASGERGLSYLPAGAGVSILVAARVYRGIGTALREREFDYWSSRARVSGGGKLAITLRALAAAAGAQAGRAVAVPLAPPRIVPPRYRAPGRQTEADLAD